MALCETNLSDLHFFSTHPTLTNTNPPPSKILSSFQKIFSVGCCTASSKLTSVKGVTKAAAATESRIMLRFRIPATTMTRAVLSAVSLSASYAYSPTVCSTEDSSAENVSTAGNEHEMRLKHVIIILRHGDRAPVSKSIGPMYPQTKEIDNLWRSKLPSGPTEELLKGVAKSQSIDSDDNLYNGRDLEDHPYGQLTEIGVRQCIAVGSHLRRVYVDEKGFLPNVMSEDIIYSRSVPSMNSFAGIVHFAANKMWMGRVKFHLFLFLQHSLLLV